MPEDRQFVAGDAIGDLRYKDGMSGDVLTIKRHGGANHQVKLKGERVKALLGHDWHRHQVSRAAGQALD